MSAADNGVNHSPSSPSLAKLSLGTAPDSWGVWFPRDDHQVGWEQYLDEVALAGYLYTELGPQGFLPQDPEQLRDEGRGDRVQERQPHRAGLGVVQLRDLLAGDRKSVV